MTENSWATVNLNSFSDVWTPDDLRPNDRGSPGSVIQAWGSMAWDSNRGDLIFWGGGHANYAGNEVYRWRATTQEWERASLPSRITEVDPVKATYETVDGPLNAPISSHTYDNQLFLEIADRFLTFGGSAYNDGAGFTIDDGTGTRVRTGPYLWDPSKADANAVGGTDGSGVDPSSPGGEMWENRDNIRDVPTGSSGFRDMTTAVTTEDGKDVVYFDYGKAYTDGLWKLTIHDPEDPSKDTYEKVGRRYNVFEGSGAGDIDPTRNLYLRSCSSYFSSCNGGFTFYDLNEGVAGPSNRNQFVSYTDLTGGVFVPGSGYGLVYDEGRDRFVIWGGDDNLFALTAPETLGPSGWTLDLIDPVSLVTPETASLGIFTGVLGKFDYLSGLDVFAGVVDPVAGDVWIYKPENWSPAGDGDGRVAVAVAAPSAVMPFLMATFAVFGMHRRGHRRRGGGPAS